MTTTQVASAVTEGMSLAAVRNFLRAAVSCITFSRGLCGDDSFVSYNFLGVDMQQLCSTSVAGAQIIAWLSEGAFDALNKKYLKEMALCILSADGTETLESYCFTITYASDGADRAAVQYLTTSDATQGTQPAAAASQVTSCVAENAASGAALLSSVPTGPPKRRTKEQIVKDMCQLFTQLGEQIGRLPPLLPDRVVTMRLLYNDSAPPNYQPPSFEQASTNMTALYRREMGSELRLGSVDAKHLTVAASIRHPLYQVAKRATLESQNSAGTSTAGRGTASYSRVSASVNEFSTVTGGSDRVEHESSSDVRAGAGTSARPAFAITAKQLVAVRTVKTLVTSSEALRPPEVCFLVFTAFVFSMAPILRGGHAEMRRADAERYVEQQCVFRGVPVETFLAVIQKLLKQGLVSLSANASEWYVCDPPALLVAKLYRHAQVCIYLQPAELEQLETLHRRLVQKEAAASQTTKTKPAATRQKRPRSAVTGW